MAISKSLGAAASIAVPTTDNSKSTTRASIAHGTIITRDGATDLSALSRDCLLDSQALKPIFDEEKVREKIELGQVKIRTCCDENRTYTPASSLAGPQASLDSGLTPKR